MPPPHRSSDCAPCSVWGCKQDGACVYRMRVRVCVHHWTYLNKKDRQHASTATAKKGAAFR